MLPQPLSNLYTFFGGTILLNLNMRSERFPKRKMFLVGEPLRRRSFIRLMRHWHGTVSTADIQTAFGLSRAQAHRILRAARDDPVDGVAIGDAAVFLAHLRSQTASDSLQSGLGISFGVPVEEGDLLTRPPVREDVLRAILEALRTAKGASRPGDKTWPRRYAARRIAWHVLDHAWEIEDRS